MLKRDTQVYAIGHFDGIPKIKKGIIIDTDRTATPMTYAVMCDDDSRIIANSDSVAIKRDDLHNRFIQDLQEALNTNEKKLEWIRKQLETLRQ